MRLSDGSGWIRPAMSAVLVAAAVMTAGGCAKPDPNMTLIVQGNEAIDIERSDPALAAADTYLQKSPDGPHAAEAYYIRGRAYEIKARREAVGSAAYLQSARMSYIDGLKRKPTGQLEAYLRSGLANVAFFQDDFQTAYTQWQAAYAMVDGSDLRAWILLRMGNCQQRMGRFEAGDQLLDRVVRLYPNTEPARRAREKSGARSFSLLLGTVSTPQAAEAVAEKLRGQGIVLKTASDSPGVYQLRVEPLATYDGARQVKNQLATAYPSAVIIP